MKKFFKRILSLIVLIPCFAFAACTDMGGGDSPESEYSGAMETAKNAAESGFDFMSLTTELPANSPEVFKGAYVIVDPGYNGTFTDGYLPENDPNASKPFVDMVERELTILGEDLANRLFMVYGENAAKINYSLDFTENISVNVQAANILTDEIYSAENKLTKSSTVSKMLNENMLNISSIVSLFPLLEGDTESLEVLDFLNNNFKFVDAIKGGYEFAINNNSTPENAEDDTADFTENLVAENKWKLGTKNGSWNYTQENELKTELVNQTILAVANAVAGMDNSNTDVELAYQSINHLGFTASEKVAVVDGILNNIIGEDNVVQDNLYYDNLLNVSESDDIDDPYEYSNIVTGVDAEDWLYSHYYKAYRVVVENLIDQAFSMFGNDSAIVDDPETTDVDESIVDIYKPFPRAQVLEMSIFTLQGTTAEEVAAARELAKAQEEEAGEDNTQETEYDGNSEETNTEEMAELVPYLPELNIITIVLMPDYVEGVRGETTPRDESGNEITDRPRVAVEGFMLGSVDFAVAGENGYNSKVQAEFIIKAQGNDIKNVAIEEHPNYLSNTFEIFSDTIPVANGESFETEESSGGASTSDSSANVYTDVCPIDAIIEAENPLGMMEEYRLMGYNGLQFSDCGLTSQSKTTEVSEDATYTEYTLKTNVDYLSIDENGNFACEFGDNFVQINFNFLEIIQISNEVNVTASKVNTIIQLLAFNPEALVDYA